MKTSKTTMAKDPICGMDVDESKAIHAERNGETFYFCGEKCREKFLTKSTSAKAEEKSGSCCG